MEHESSKRARKKNIQKIVLQTIATTGFIGIALVAPNVLGVMNTLGLLPSRRQKESINRARDALIKKGLLEYKNGSVQISPSGERVLRIAESRDYKIQKPRRWDGKWRILIFDIPEYKKNHRDQIRRILRSIGFICIQDSVWIYPYDCEDTILLVKTDLSVGKEVLYLIVDSLENDSSYRKHFSLRLH